MGAQDNFEFALRFVADTGVATPTMLWDPTFQTWNQYGIRINSSMILLSGDLTRGTDPRSGFGSSDQQWIIDNLGALA